MLCSIRPSCRPVYNQESEGCWCVTTTTGDRWRREGWGQQLTFLCGQSLSWFRGSQASARGLRDGWVQLRWSWLGETDLMRAEWGHNLTLRTPRPPTASSEFSICCIYSLKSRISSNVSVCCGQFMGLFKRHLRCILPLMWLISETQTSCKRKRNQHLNFMSFIIIYIIII